MVKVCKSEITKEIYTIEQKIPKNVKTTEKENERIIPNDYYETDGAFCSFNCCMAFIKDNIHNPLYKNSKNLLIKMYIHVFNPTSKFKINTAPSWRLLKSYGGFMGIDEFRNSFNTYIYIDKNHMLSSIPKLNPNGKMFEELYIF